MVKHSPTTALPEDPLWYKDAIIYQVHVRAFKDSDADGAGDFQGLTSRLDYLEDLGINTIWLLPFYPSPLKDDGYDIADYTAIHPSYGTLADFNRFVKEAHRRGLRVITELVINHTSDQHPWFQMARKAPKGSKERDFYVWSDSMEKYAGTRIIFKDFESSNWSADPVAGAYFWHRFYSHQPDLNFDNPRVRKSIIQLMELWFKRGVDGMRLDAVPYLYEREGTSCENLPETHAFLKQLRRHIDARFPNRMLLAEANQWPEDAAAYFGNGDECHMAFHFPIMPRLFMAIRQENRFPIVDILNETPPIPDSAQWAMFLRNHDELTLEMVTDRERDYMYQVYARDREMRINLGIRRRLAPLLGNERRAIELMNSLLLSLNGTPVIYYGDEIGMGDNIFLGDRNGVRTPMQWSADRNAGFSRANPQRLYLPVIIDPEYHYEAVNVENQQNNPRSLLWWMKRMIHLRRQYQAFGRGSLEFVSSSNPKIIAFIRRYREEILLVVANLSRYSQCVQLELNAFEGLMPVEIGGGAEFTIINDQPYPMTMDAYAYYWFALQAPREDNLPAVSQDAELPVLELDKTWENLFKEKRGPLEAVLTGYLRQRRWFGGKARKLETLKISDTVRIKIGPRAIANLLILRVEYSDGSRESYLLPITCARGERAEQIREQAPGAIVALLSSDGRDAGLLFDAMWDERFTAALMGLIRKGRPHKDAGGVLTVIPTRAARMLIPRSEEMPEARVLQSEQSNTSVFFGDRVILKLFRRIESGINPDFEIGHALTEKVHFDYTPPLAGALTYKPPHQDPATIAIAHGFIENQGDAWQFTLEYLSRYYENALAKEVEIESAPMTDIQNPLDCVALQAPELARELFGVYQQHAELLGQRSGEFHCALASLSAEPDFKPDPFTMFYRQAQYQSMRGLCTQVFRMLRERRLAVPEPYQDDMRRVLALEAAILDRFRPIKDYYFTSTRIRTHGDYHLGQVLFTGKDFMIMDFEGEPARSLNERRDKVSALRDVAGMLRSLHYASFAALFSLRERGSPIRRENAEPWRKYWYLWSGAAFLRGYLAVTAQSGFMPRDRDELVILVHAYALEKAIYELGYELNNRPDWIGIPLQGILEIMGQDQS
jgi:maltose alpha-D-glucosyltransferase / alpha-amylase